MRMRWLLVDPVTPSLTTCTHPLTSLMHRYFTEIDTHAPRTLRTVVVFTESPARIRL
jgi:hypothetical protein